MTRVHLPYHLRNPGGVASEIEMQVPAPPTVRALLLALEARYPALRSAIVDIHTRKRRPLIRFSELRPSTGTSDLSPANVLLPAHSFATTMSTCGWCRRADCDL